MNCDASSKDAGKKWVSSVDMRQSFFPDRACKKQQEVHCILGWQFQLMNLIATQWD